MGNEGVAVARVKYKKAFGYSRAIGSKSIFLTKVCVQSYANEPLYRWKAYCASLPMREVTTELPSMPFVGAVL